MNARRNAILALAAAALLAAGAMWAAGSRNASPPNAPPPQIAADFAALARGIDALELETHAGGRIAWGALNGRPRAVFFGFTHCPEICPVTIWQLGAALQQLGLPRNALRLDFVSVDPERDTPQRLGEYLQSFDANVLGLHADAPTLERLTRSFEVSYERRERDGGAYSIDHTATVFLLNSRGQVVDVIAYGSPPDVVGERLRALLAAE